ncbi:DUF222 domain-containing protein [Kribbella sp. NPDC004875]|uniref:HNH endonuclease n=1 Tax=Kribbella sp. NPDC004875 TaxID=3364107 RepID=UPI003699D00C
METLGERPVWSMSGSEMLDTIDQLDAELARLETYRLQVISGLDAVGYAREIGAQDTVQLLEYRYLLDHVRARRDVRLALALPKYPTVTEALPAVDPFDSRDPDTDPADDSRGPAPRLRTAQAEAIVSALEQVPPTVPVEDLNVVERELVGLARHLCPAELRKAGQRARDILDTDGPEPEEQKAYARETLTLSTADRGVKFRGYLANENAELLRTLIHAGARPHKTVDGAPDPRPHDKRQADALTTALTIAATTLDTTTPANRQANSAGHSSKANAAGHAGEATAGGHASEANAAGHAGGANADGHASDSTTAGHTRGANADGHASEANTAGHAGGANADGHASEANTAGHAGGASDGGTGGQVPGFGAKANITVTIDLADLRSTAADAIGDVVYGDGLSAAALRLLACDAKIIPLVLGSNSEPLDVGRSQRLVTRSLRRALNARDRGCVVCGAPPIMCDAHHLISWLHGGDTKLTNLALLCRRHHRALHAGEWTITIINNQVHVSRPTWTTPPPSRTNHPRPPNAQPPANPRPTTPHTPTPAPTPAPTAAHTPTPAHTPAAAHTPTPAPTAANTRSTAPTAVPTPTSARTSAAAPTITNASAPNPISAALSDHPAPAFGAIANRSAIGRELLTKLTSTTEPGTPASAHSLHEAASRAIWGESTTTDDPQAHDTPHSQTTASPPADHRADPWADPPADTPTPSPQSAA